MLSAFALSLNPQANFRRVSPGELLVTSALGDVRLELLPEVADALALLTGPVATEEDMENFIKTAGGDLPHLSILYYSLQRLMARGLICYTVAANGEPLATLRPQSPVFKLDLSDISADRFYQLSRFAFCRRDGQTLVLESPLSLASILLHDRGVHLLAKLVTPRSANDLVDVRNDLSERIVQQFLILLAGGGFLITTGLESGAADDLDPTYWEFHDLLFHSRSRLGRRPQTYGGTYRFAGNFAPLPAVAPSLSGNITKLAKPDIRSLMNSDLPFSRVIEERCSTREFGQEPITVEQLGEFLYRTARVRRLFKDGRQELTNRPYPNGGALYELEIYLAVNRCAELTAGLYHYCPLQHELAQVSSLTSEVRSLLHLASEAAGVSQTQVLIILSARFQRVSWKYESMAYALILKNVGVLYQTMYLVATAMGLAGCGLGGGDSDLFSRAAHTQSLVETSVGEFLLGSKPSQTSLASG